MDAALDKCWMFTPTETLFDSEGFSRLHTHMHTNTYTQTRSVLGSPLVNHCLHHHFSFLLLYEKIVFIYLFIFGCADDMYVCVCTHPHMDRCCLDHKRFITFCYAYSLFFYNLNEYRRTAFSCIYLFALNNG